MIAESNPSNAGGNGGRQAGGKFAAGNKFGKGNPALKRIHALRTRMLKYATVKKHNRVLKSLFDLAVGAVDERARLGAIQEWFVRTMGKPQIIPLPPSLSEADAEADAPTLQALEEFLAQRTRSLTQPQSN